MNTSVPLLDVNKLALEFRTRGGTVHALENVNFHVNAGEIVGIVGESGSGKSILAHALLRILDPAGRVTAGRAHFDGLDVLAATEAQMRGIRGRKIAMIFQNPRAALNPIRKIGRQLEDVLARHTTAPRRDIKKRAMACLEQVRIPDPARRYHAYPFELSGGQCQRVMIALAIAAEPALLIADEPTTGLDVTTQAVVMELIRELVHRNRMAAILITHDLALASESCDRIVVMHAGHVVETAPTRALFKTPRHPYTARLIGATPQDCVDVRTLASIPGALPDLRAARLPPCRFSARCERYASICDQPLPHSVMSQRHTVACWSPLNVA